MAITIIYEVDCHCGGRASMRMLDLTNPQDDGTIQIDVQMSIESETFTCDDCGCNVYTGDIDIFTEPGQHKCPGPTDDEESDDDQEAV